MKKRRLKKWVKDFIAMSIIVLIGVLSIFAMCERAEQLDNMVVSYEKNI